MAELPRGTVTFLFTDIEGSTALWERDRRAMAPTVARHLALLDAAIAAHEGEHFKTVGDAVQAAFQTAPAAVAAAFAAQQSLLAEDWGEIGDLRVRMALHAGEAEPDPRGDYLAAPLNRLSRLLSTGHGGQILLTQAVQQLTRGALPVDVELRDLGEHRLRNLLEPEHVFQLVHPDLPSDFPALRSLDARPHNLPLQLTPFLGREREVGEVVDWLGRPDVRLLTLTGPGGIGKSRLALQAAAELLDDFVDGVFFVPLASVADSELVPATIASVLGIHEQRGRSLVARLQDFLTRRELLLVLDNLEHVIEAAPLIGELLGVAPGLRVLATSRLPLRLRVEREYPVPPLELPRRYPLLPPEQLSQNEAVRLFIERAQAVNPDFAVDNDNASAITEICHRLDGLPLAIELAATWVRLLPPQVLLARLEKQLFLLTGGARDAPIRQRTLRDTIAWSYDLLAPEDQVLLQRLSVFVGEWTLDAAESVGNSKDQLDVLQGLLSLAERSLVRRVEGSADELRFSMFETIREYGMEQLAASGEEEQARERHAAWALALAERAEPELFGANQQSWWQRLEAERSNIRAALAWFEQTGDAERAQRLAGSVAAFNWMRSHFQEGQAWLQRALAIPGETSPAARTWALIGSWTMAWLSGDYDAMRALTEQALAVSRSGDFALGSAMAQHMLAMNAWTHGDLEQAIVLGEEAIARVREAGNPNWLAISLGDMGTVARLKGDHERGEAWSAEALALHRALGNRYFIATNLNDLGLVTQERGDLVEASRHYAESARLYHELGDTSHIASPLAGLAGFSVAHGQPDAAARLLGVAATLREATGFGVWPWEQERDEQTAVSARAALGQEEYTREFVAGRAMQLEQAVAEAIAIVAQAGLFPSFGETS